MAQITLGAGETANGGQPLFGNNTIFGTTTGGGQTVVIGGGQQIFGADFNAGGDTIVLAGAANQYQISRSGSTIVITGPNGTEVRFPAPNPSLSADQQPSIVFNNGTLTNTSDDISYKLATSSAGQITLGSQAITTTASTVGGGTTNPVGVTLNVTATNVTEGGAITYTFTLSSAQTSAVTINVATAGGTATPGTDFTAVSTAITFQPGQTTQFLTVNTIDDTLPEAAETVSLQINLPSGITLASTANVTAVISDNDNFPVSSVLTTGNDTFTGGDAADRFVGAQNTTEPGKLLSANDVINGGAGIDTIELTNAPANAFPNVLADVDFTNVTNVETLVTNYATVQLGAQADKAGIVTVDTATRTDSQNVANNFIANGTTLDLTSDLNADGVADFNNVLTVSMANSATDTVRLALATAAGSAINTGTTFTPTATSTNLNPTALGAIDNIIIANQVNPVRVTFTSTAVGNGTAFDADGTTLAVAVQSEDANDNLVGGVVRFDDEGIRFAGGQFDVRDVSGTARGTFNEVVLGTALSETTTLAANLPNGSTLGSYINAGGGDDVVTGSANADFLVGGAGNDTLNGGAGSDSLLGGAGNDIINGGAGIDTLLDGGEGSDIYTFADGEFVANETVADSGTGANDVDYLAITSSTALTDAQFAGRTGIEGLATNVTNSGAVEVTIGTNAQATGIRTVYAGDDDLTASAYTADLTVYGTGATVTGSGNDTIVLQNQTAQQATLVGLGHTTSSAGFQAFTGSVNGGSGNDTVIGGYALANTNTTLTGGTGTDTLVLGGAVNGQGGTLATGTTATYTLNFGSGFTGFEAIQLNAAPTGSAVAYNLSFVDANVASGTTLAINGGALRGSTSVNNATFNETLTVNASALTGTRAVSVTGGAGDDVLTGGAGADTLNGGAGNDTITGGAGNDTLNGGEGSDNYIYADGELVAAEILADTGTAGTDTITVTSSTALTDAVFANKSGVEVLTTTVTTGTVGDMTSAGANAEVTLGANAQAAGIVTVNNGEEDLNASAYTVGLTVNTNGGSVITGSGNDVVNVLPFSTNAVYTGAGDDKIFAGFNLFAGTTIDGGAGSDELVVGGTVVRNGVSVNTDIERFGRGNNFVYVIPANANLTNVERLTLVGGTNGSAAGAGNAISYSITADNANVAAGQTAVVDASSLGTKIYDLGGNGAVGGGDDLSATETLTFNGSAETDGSYTVLGGAGNDVITGGAQADTLTGNAGNDVLNGGLGNDTLNGGDGNDTLNGGDGNDTLEGGAGDDTLVGGAGNDTIRGGAGNDSIIVTGTEFANDGDSVDGGDGTDTLEITGGGSIGDFGFSGRYTSIEALRLSNGVYNFSAGQFAQAAGFTSYSFGANASGSTISVSGLNAGTTLNDIISASNSVTFVGSSFADTINIGVANTTQGGGTDVVQAGAGNDVINVGSTLTTADLINGQGGSDTLNVSGNGTTQTVTLSVAAVGGATPSSGIYSIETIALAAGLASTAGTAVATPGSAGTATSYNVTVNDTSFESTTASLTVDGSALRVVSTGAGADGIFGTSDDATTGEVLNFNGGAVSSGHVLTVTGGAANDSIVGGAGADVLNGGGGADFISGGDGNDVIDGGAGGDQLYGGNGNDTITGGTGSDLIVGGAGIDAINLGGDGARDTVIINDGDAGRGGTSFGVEAISGFQAGSVTSNAFTSTADVIDFGSNMVANGLNASVNNGVVQAGSVLQNAINSSTSLLAAIQLVEQEFNTQGFDGGKGVVAFTYQGNTYIGELSDVNAAANAITAAFTDIVQITGVTGVTALFDTDGNAGFGYGLQI